MSVARLLAWPMRSISSRRLAPASDQVAADVPEVVEMDPLEVGSGDRRDPDQVPERPRVGGPGVLSGRDGNRKRATAARCISRGRAEKTRYREVGRCTQLDVSPDREDAKLPGLGARWPRRTDAARAETLLDDYRKRRSCGGGSNSTNPSQSWHAAKSSLFARGSLVARASHFGQSKLSSWQVCPRGNSEDFQHVLLLIYLRSDPFQ